jgi:mannosyltransferase OCH1-like enzyme
MRVNKNQYKSLEQILKSSFFQNQRLPDDFHIKWKDSEYWIWIINQYQNFIKNSENKKEIVPKKIHQIWINGKVPKKYQMWRNSWMKNNPDYEYFLWDEKEILKFELANYKQFIKTKYPVVKSNLARHEILYKFGGIYVDTDFESLKRIDKKYLTCSFIAGQMFDYAPHINDALMISSKGSKLSELVINGFKNRKHSDRMSPMEILQYCGVFYLTEIIRNNRESLKDIVIMPSQYFYPWPNFFKSNHANRYSYVTKKTWAIHHWEVSWYKNSIFTRIFKKIKIFLDNNR